MVADKHNPVLIVIAGPNGSGKTTITSKILRHEWMEDAIYVNPDQVAQERFGDWSTNWAIGQHQLLYWCAPRQGHNIIQPSNLLSGR